MRSESPKIQENINKLLDAFKSQDSLSTSEIKAIIGVKERKSVENYKTRLENMGYTFETLPGKPPKYRLSDTECYENMTANILRKYLIMQKLQGNPISKNEFPKHFTLSDSPDADECLPKSYEYTNYPYCDRWKNLPLTLIDINKTSFNKLLKELLEENQIILASDNNKYYLTGILIPLVLRVDFDVLNDISYQMSNIPKGSPYYVQLHSVYCKINTLLNGITETEFIDSQDSYENNYLLYGQKREALSISQAHIQNLIKCHFRENTVEITYKTKANDIITSLCNTGMLVYCVDKDVMYILGEEDGDDEKKGRPLHIDLKSIIKIEPSPLKNPIYRSEAYTRLFNTMFGISSEPETDVRVEFDDLSSIRLKLNILHKQRPYSKLDDKLNPGKIIYTDTIRGIADFATFLRQFGKSVRVLAPDILKEKLHTSAEETLKLYIETETSDGNPSESL